MDPGPKRPRPPQDFRTRDLRRGVLALALAMAVAGIGFALPEEDMTRVFLAAAGLPAAIGLAYLVLWQFADRGGNGTT